VITLKPAGAVAPLKPILVLPEVLDESAWFQNRLWWADAEEPYTTLMFQGSVQSAAAYNTRLMDPTQFRSYRDLLDPRWKGKMVATDIRESGPGAVPARFMYKHPELGPRFLEQLYSEMDMVLSSDQRQLIDWLSQGQYPLGLLLAKSSLIPAMEQGLPIGIVPDERFREGTAIGPGGGAVNLMDRAPHPNAAKLFVNWLLSREGQIAWQSAHRENSLRVDIPKDDVFPFDAPQPGAKYVDAGTEEYAHVTTTLLKELVKG
jgi:iron(III) transport system substrate-binding protein